MHDTDQRVGRSQPAGLRSAGERPLDTPLYDQLVAERGAPGAPDTPGAAGPR